MGDTQTERFEFPAPLSEVKEFLGRQRDIHTVTFNNVSLQPGQKTDVQVVEPRRSGTPVPDMMAAQPSPDVRHGVPDLQMADRINLQYAEQQFKLIEAKYKVGNATFEEFLAAKRDRDLAAAEMNGDALAAARAKLEYAEERLKFIEAQFKSGFKASEEDFLKAKRDRDLAEEELKALSDKSKADTPSATGSATALPSATGSASAPPVRRRRTLRHASTEHWQSQWHTDIRGSAAQRRHGGVVRRFGEPVERPTLVAAGRLGVGETPV